MFLSNKSAKLLKTSLIKGILEKANIDDKKLSPNKEQCTKFGHSSRFSSHIDNINIICNLIIA